MKALKSGGVLFLPLRLNSLWWSLLAMDRISRLPDSMIIFILSLLSDKEAKATSVMSKTWLRINDLITTYLCFDDSRIPSTQFPSFILRVLRRGTTDIQRVTLRLNSVYNADQTNLWIQAMEVRHVKEVILFFQPCHALIPELFNCKTIEALHVYGMVRLDLPPLINLPRLKILNLDLEDIDFGTNGIMPELLSGCGALEELRLELRSSTSTGFLVIRSPRLRKFELRFSGCGPNPTIIDLLLSDTPALESLDLSFISAVPQVYLLRLMLSLREVKMALGLQEGHFLGDSARARVGFLGSLYYIESLSLCYTTMKLLYSGPMFQLREFPNVTKLDIGVKRNFDPTMRLLEYMPNVEELVFRMAQRTLKYWKIVELGTVPKCILTSLKTIEFRDFAGSEMEMTMAKYCLRHAKGLRTMRISIFKSSRPRTSGRRFAAVAYLLDHNLDGDIIRQELSMTPRASVALQLIIS